MLERIQNSVKLATEPLEQAMHSSPSGEEVDSLVQVSSSRSWAAHLYKMSYCAQDRSTLKVTQACGFALQCLISAPSHLGAPAPSPILQAWKLAPLGLNLVLPENPYCSYLSPMLPPTTSTWNAEEQPSVFRIPQLSTGSSPNFLVAESKASN